MTVSSENLVGIDQTLERSKLLSFLDETARFYDCRLVILDRQLTVVAAPNGGEKPVDLPVRDANGVWCVDSPLIHAVTVYGETLGFVVAEPVETGGDRAAEALSRHFANLISELAAKEYELNDLSREILESYEEVNLFYDIAASLGQAEDVKGICSMILEKACEIIRVSRSSILLLDGKSGELFIAAARGIDEVEAKRVRIPVGQGISGKVLESRVPRLVDDVELLPQDLLAGYERYTTRSFISVPLVVDRRIGSSDGRAIGVINMTDKESGEDFTSGDLKLLTALANQAAVLIENFRLIDLEKELQIARRIQRSLLPEAPPRVPGVDLHGVCVPAHNVGGDYYDFVHHEEEGRLALLVADVSGHDIASALMMAVARSGFRNEIRKSHDPEVVLDQMNLSLYDDLTRAELFLSVFCCLYDVGTRKLRYANAGHGPALLCRPESGGTRPLDAEGLLVGVLESVSFQVAEADLEPGDVVLLHTDGIIEATDTEGAMFGLERLASALERWTHLDAASILDRIFEEVYAFAGGGEQADDMTAVVLKVTEPGADKGLWFQYVGEETEG